MLFKSLELWRQTNRHPKPGVFPSSLLHGSGRVDCSTLSPSLKPTSLLYRSYLPPHHVFINAEPILTLISPICLTPTLQLLAHHSQLRK